jgi:crotonobetainyl-CoA:carnitine CoA-transferase CaiB-like acyl-CoA transferase
LCEALGHFEWARSPEFANNGTRLRNRTQLAALIESVTITEPCSHWLAVLAAHQIPAGPVNDYSEVFADPQIAAREMVVETEHPVLGPLCALGSPIKLSATPADARRRAPLLGEHTDEVLGEAGYSADEIASLRRSGVIVSIPETA